MKILVINGPNLNLLGVREPGIYGKSTYEDLCNLLKEALDGVDYELYQSNHEGDIVDKIQAATYQGTPPVIVNNANRSSLVYSLLWSFKMLLITSVEKGRICIWLLARPNNGSL